MRDERGRVSPAWRSSPSAARRAVLGLVIVAAITGMALAVSGQALVPPELRTEARRLLGDLAALRGLPTSGGAPPLVIQSTEERRRYVVAEFSRAYSPARIDAERRALVAWGLIPADFDLAVFLADLHAEQAAAYYDPGAKRMVLANWLTAEMRRDALTHELVHVLQDRLFDLGRFLGAAPGRSDETAARRALVEGEAVALVQDLSLRREGRDFAALPDVADLQRAIRTSVSGPVVGRAPAYIRTMLTFPYAAGVGFIHAFRRRHPWAELSALYQDPPRSSAQILHPERYFDRREDPVPLPLPDLAAILPAGSRLALEDELGEVGLAEVLRRFLGESARVSGWRGDRHALWDLPAGGSALVTLTAWDTEELAVAFARDYTRVLTLKHGLAAPAQEAPLLAWVSGTAAVAIERRHRTVAFVEWAPPSALDAVRAAIWAKPVLY